MNKPDLNNLPPYPPEWNVSPEEDRRHTFESIAELERTGMGITLDDLAAWFKARRTDPNTPCPPLWKLRLSGLVQPQSCGSSIT